MEVVTYEVIILTPDGEGETTLNQMEKEVNSLSDVVDIYPQFRGGKISKYPHVKYPLAEMMVDDDIAVLEKQLDLVDSFEHFLSRQSHTEIKHIFANWHNYKANLEAQILRRS